MSFLLYNRAMPAPAPTEVELRAAMESSPAPVKHAATLLFLYACINTILAIVVAALTHIWLLVLSALLSFFYPVLLGSNLYQAKKWSYATAVLGGLYFAVRPLWMLPHPPQSLKIPYALFATSHCVTAVFGLAIAACLLLPAARAHFFPAKQTTV